MGPGQPARHAPERDLRHARRILVAVRKGPPLASPGEVPDLRAGLPLLQHPAAPARRERLRHPLPGHRRPVAPDEKRGLSAGPGGPRLPPEGLVALRGGARVAGQRDQPDQRRVGVPRVRGAAGPAGGERLRLGLSRPGRPVAPDEKQRPAPRTGGGEQQPVRLVAVRAGAYVAGPGGPAGPVCHRLPLLHGPQGPAGVQRPGVLRAPGRRPVGHGAQRVPAPRPGDRGQRQARLVALRGGARLESQSVFPDGEDAHRLPRLRRGRQDQFHPPLPCAFGGAE